MQDYQQPRKRTNQFPSPPVMALDEVDDVGACMSILRFMRERQRCGKKFYYFSPVSAVGDCLIDLWQCQLVTITRGRPGCSYWLAELVVS